MAVLEGMRVGGFPAILLVVVRAVERRMVLVAPRSITLRLSIGVSTTRVLGWV